MADAGIHHGLDDEANYGEAIGAVGDEFIVRDDDIMRLPASGAPVTRPER